MLSLDWLHGLLAIGAVLAPSLYNRFMGGSAQDALAKFPILNFLVKTLAARANLSAAEQQTVAQALGDTHPAIPAQVLALQTPQAPAAK